MATLEAMIRQGIYPGPAACHALILAHAKAEDPEGALLVLRLMQAAALNPFEETYALVLQLCALHGHATEAVAVLEELPVDKQLVPWVALCTALFAVDAEGERGYSLLEDGEARGLEAPPALQEEALCFLCARSWREEVARRWDLLVYTLSYLHQLLKMDEPLLEYLASKDLAALMDVLCNAQMLYEVVDLLNIMRTEGRHIDPGDIPNNGQGLSMFTSWLPDPALAEVDDAPAPPDPEEDRAWIVRDGVMLNAATKCVVDMAGEPVAVQQMTNRQLRVELQLHQHPVSGNKADLCRRLTLAREGKSAQHVKAILAGPRVATIVRNHELWVNGKLVQSIPKLTRIPLDERGKEIKPRPRVRKGVPDPEKEAKRASDLVNAKLDKYQERMDYLGLLGTSSLSRVPVGADLSEAGTRVAQSLLALNLVLPLCARDWAPDLARVRGLARLFPERERELLLGGLRRVELQDDGARSTDELLRAMHAEDVD
ncbi:hypothetical protein QBZ16_001032 [Prototheca wickerhamii]|uniref:SAP domain-containing protein n=1 Tax=Prototheca wickerhamii TaxID=3111 RepID=A0AAD9IE13_PROWI|nr:hypothetical protein QBZ16_001032 [Prototheca wickerhamii]